MHVRWYNVYSSSEAAMNVRLCKVRWLPGRQLDAEQTVRCRAGGLVQAVRWSVGWSCHVG
jgi:hypothetical protein